MMGSSVTVVQGFDMDKYLESKMVTDFYVTDATVDNVTSQYNDYAGVSEEDRETFSKIDGITGIGSVYMLEGSHKVEGKAVERAKKKSVRIIRCLLICTAFHHISGIRLK